MEKSLVNRIRIIKTIYDLAKTSETSRLEINYSMHNVFPLDLKYLHDEGFIDIIGETIGGAIIQVNSKLIKLVEDNEDEFLAGLI